MFDEKKIIRAVTVAQSVEFFTGIISELKETGYEEIGRAHV